MYVCVWGEEVKDCCVYKNRREKKSCPAAAAAAVPGLLPLLAAKSIRSMPNCMFVFYRETRARGRSLPIRLLPSSAHTHTHTHPKLFFLILFILFFARLPSGTGRCRYEGVVFWVCPPICVCLGYQLEQSNKLAKREREKTSGGKLSIAQT